MDQIYEQAARFHCERAEEEAKAARLATRRAQIALRPSICLGARIERVEAGWAAQLDDVWAFGSTPEEAFENFDLVWIQGDDDDETNDEPGGRSSGGSPAPSGERSALRVD